MLLVFKLIALFLFHSNLPAHFFEWVFYTNNYGNFAILSRSTYRFIYGEESPDTIE